MKTEVANVLECTAYERADLAEIVREIQAMEGARLERGNRPLPLLSRPVMLRMLADLRRELQAVRKARVSLERLARSRNRRWRRSLVPLNREPGPRAAGRPALLVVQKREVR